MTARLSSFGIALATLGACSTPMERTERDAIGIVEAAHRAPTTTTDLRARLAELEALLAKEREIRSAAEAREREWIEERRRLVARILEISLERVRLERELLAAQIERIERDLDSTAPATSTAPAPSTTRHSPTESVWSSDQALDKIRLPRR